MPQIESIRDKYTLAIRKILMEDSGPCQKSDIIGLMYWRKYPNKSW